MARFKLQQVFSDDSIYVWDKSQPSNIIDWSIPTHGDDDCLMWSINHIEFFMRGRVNAACSVVDGDCSVGNGEFLIETDDNRVYLLLEM